MKLNKKLKQGSKEHMLETLRLAYQFVLGQYIDLQPYSSIENSKLSEEEQKELGRRLASYWLYKNSNVCEKCKKVRTKPKYKDVVRVYY